MNEAMVTEPDWGVITRAVLSRWHDVQHEPDLPESVLRFVDRAADIEPAVRQQFVEALRRRLGSLPLDDVHPSWIASILPEDPLLRLWSLGSLPRHVRREVAACTVSRADEPGCWACEAPPWIAEWWRAELAKRLHYPLRLPGAISADQPLDYLFLLQTSELERVLGTFGLRPLAAALRGLDPKKVVELVMALPRVVRARLTEISRLSHLPAVDPWFDLLRQHLEKQTPIESLPALLALEDLGVQARALGRKHAALRLALRLDRKQGLLLQQRVEFGNEALVDGDLEGWQRNLRTDLSDLVRVGLVKVPDLEKEGWQS